MRYTILNGSGFYNYDKKSHLKGGKSMISNRLTSIVVLVIVSGIIFTQCEEKMSMKEPTFKQDVSFLKQYTEVIVLSEEEGDARLAICPELQGRIMTSTANGEDGMGFGWINYKFFEEGKQNDHMNAYGGEDRLWLGPEGGQYSIFFKPGVSMTFENWFTPPPINSESWVLVEQTKTSVAMRKEMRLTNYSGTEFDLRIDRSVALLMKESIERILGVQVTDGLDYVAYETENIITNTGQKAWDKETGALSIWMLDMLKTSPNATVVIPFKEGEEKELGPVATTNYFGEIPPDRIKTEKGVIYFKVDGNKRGKLGLSWKRVKPFAGSYDADARILTLIAFSVPKKERVYVNSLWELQDEPFKGDVLNSYNDGPLEDGSQMGPFYEIESSSPAALLKPGESITHYHRVFHFVGEESDLDQIAKQTLGVSIDQIKAVF
jgi:hypothetical protein